MQFKIQDRFFLVRSACYVYDSVHFECASWVLRWLHYR